MTELQQLEMNMTRLRDDVRAMLAINNQLVMRCEELKKENEAQLATLLLLYRTIPEVKLLVDEAAKKAKEINHEQV